MGKLAAPLGYSSNTPNDKHTGDTINGKKVSARIAAHCRAAAACNAPNTAALIYGYLSKVGAANHDKALVLTAVLLGLSLLVFVVLDASDRQPEK